MNHYFVMLLLCVGNVVVGAWNIEQFVAKGYTRSLLVGLVMMAVAFLIPLFLILVK